MRSLLAAAVLAASLSSLASAKSLQLPIRRDPNAIPIQQLRKRDPTQAHKTDVVKLAENNDKNQYSTTVYIGTPPQQINLTIDTGSSDLWVVSAHANIIKAAGSDAPDTGVDGGRFDELKSSSFDDIHRHIFNTTFADGTGATGYYFKDDVTLGTAKLTRFEMGLANRTTLTGGLIGIAFSATEASNFVTGFQYPTFLEVMVQQGVISSQMFSLWLNDIDEPGSLLFGGVDTAKYKGTMANIALVPSLDTGKVDRFTVSFTSLSINTTSGTTPITSPNMPSLPVVLDSGTSLTTLPDDIVQQVYAITGTKWYADLGGAAVPCAAVEKVQGTIDFGFSGPNGPVIKVPISEMFIKALSGGTQMTIPGTTMPACQMGIVPASQYAGPQGPLLFGDTFLRSAYVVYDLENSRVGLAQTKFNTSDSNIVEVTSSKGPIPSATTIPNEPTPTIKTIAGIPAGAFTQSNGPQYTGAAGKAFADAASAAGAVPANPTPAGGASGGSAQAAASPGSPPAPTTASAPPQPSTTGLATPNSGKSEAQKDEAPAGSSNNEQAPANANAQTPPASSTVSSGANADADAQTPAASSTVSTGSNANAKAGSGQAAPPATGTGAGADDIKIGVSVTNDNPNAPKTPGIKVTVTEDNKSESVDINLHPTASAAGEAGAKSSPTPAAAKRTTWRPRHVGLRVST